VAPTHLLRGAADLGALLSSIPIRMKEATWIGRTAYGWALGIGLKVSEHAWKAAHRRSG